MTTTTYDLVHPSTALQRVGRVVKLHFANPWASVIMPWIILGVIFAANLAIWAIITVATNGSGSDRADAYKGLQYSGASFFIFVYMMVVAVQAVSITFPFALGYGVTRRDYYLGTAATFVILSAFYAVGLTILGIIEEATHGWGLGGRMFTAIYFGDSWYQRLYIFFVGMLFFFFIGAALSAVWVRWKSNGMVAFFVAFGLLAVGVIALLTLTNGWGAFGAFFANAGLVGSVTWSLVATVIAAVAGYFILRRATPRPA